MLSLTQTLTLTLTLSRCALSMEQGAVAAASSGHPLDGVDDERAAAAEVKGLDTWVPGTGFRLLFGTPFFSTTLDGAERMNDELAALIHREQASAVAAQQRSMSGGSSFRTDDHFLTRPEPAVSRLRLAHTLTLTLFLTLTPSLTPTR